MIEGIFVENINTTAESPGMKAAAGARVWQCGRFEISLERPRIMGIVNVTPDSFSDGGMHASRDEAVQWGRRLAAEGADILDVGGESTRPGAREVSEDEELSRVIPVVEALAADGFVVSVDTSRASVMREALSAGAAILNDVRAFTQPGALEAASQSEAGLVIMHWVDAHASPREDQEPQVDDDALYERIARYLSEREQRLREAGVGFERICWDAGFGFGKTVRENFAIVRLTDRFVRTGRPYLLGLSRKSSLGAVTGIANPADRAAASVAGSLAAIERGARLVRVHDVRHMREAVDVWCAVKGFEPGLGSGLKSNLKSNL